MDYSRHKILFLTPGCFDKGGISRYSRYQIDALRDIFAPDQIRVLSLLGPGDKDLETPFEVAWNGPTSAATGFSRIAFSLESVRQVLIWRPSVIHCAHVNFGPLATRLARLCGAKKVLNVYGLELWSGLSPMRRRHVAQMDYILSDCHATADYVVDNQLHFRPPTVIWDCADLSRFRPARLSPGVSERYSLPDPDKQRVVLTLGRLSVGARHKGYDRLLEIFKKVRDRVPTACLVIAGDGDDAVRLHAKAQAFGIEQYVYFTGAIDENDLASVYRVAHVFALVSDKGPGRGEGIPLAAIEATASGVPVLVGDEDGSREAVDDSRNGIVVSPRDLKLMAEALVQLLIEAGAARERRSAEARKVAEERFSYESFIKKHRALYDEVCKNQSHNYGRKS